MTDDARMLELLLTGDVGVSYTREHGWRFTDCRALLGAIPSADDDDLPGQPLTIEVPERRGRRPGEYLRDDQIQPCGTHAAYRRHQARNEPVDDACRTANRAYDRIRKQRQRDQAKHVQGNRPLLHSLPTQTVQHSNVDQQVAS